MRNLYIILSILIFSSCTEEIDLKLKNADPVLIVDARVTNYKQEAKINLSTSTEFENTPNSPLYADNALVFLSINGEDEVEVAHSDSGNYILKNVLVEEGTTYDLRIIWNNEEYTASTNMLSSVPLQAVVFDTVFFINPNGDVEYNFNMLLESGDEGYDYYHTQVLTFDTVGKEWINDSYQYWDDENYATSGTVLFPYFASEFPLNDTIIILFSHIPQNIYNFYETLDLVAQQDPSSLAPANPEGNLSNGAIGYFGAFNTYKIKLPVIP